MTKLVSTSRLEAPRPTRPASAAFASPAPIDKATAATVTGPGNSLFEPSGSSIETIEISGKQKARPWPRCDLKRKKVCDVGTRGGLHPARAVGSSRCHNRHAFLALVVSHAVIVIAWAHIGR